VCNFYVTELVISTYPMRLAMEGPELVALFVAIDFCQEAGKMPASLAILLILLFLVEVGEKGKLLGEIQSYYCC